MQSISEEERCGVRLVNEGRGKSGGERKGIGGLNVWGCCERAGEKPKGR